MDQIISYQIPETSFFEYDPLLPEIFFKVSGLIKQENPSITVEHIGSTSVPGMPGKNSLNIAIISQREKYPVLLRSLKKQGFNDHPFKSEPEDRPLLVGGILHEGTTYWLHLHLITEGSTNHSVSLFFRDTLRKNPDLAAEYAQLKKNLVDKRASAEEYHQGKQAFIKSVIANNV